MAKLLKLRRGSTSQHSSFTGAEGEVTVDTTKDTLVVHDGSTAGGHPIAKESGNIATATTATVGTNVTVTANNSTDETVYPVFVDGATGTQGIESDTGLTYNPSSGNLTIGGELTAATLDISGNVDIDGTLEADAITVDGSTLNAVIAAQEVNVATLASTVTAYANNSNDETVYPTFVDGATGTQGLETDTGFTYNPSSGKLTATEFVGNIDAVDGDFDGTLEADAITVGGTALSTVIAGTTVTNATNATNVTVTDNESSDQNNLITFINNAAAPGTVGLGSDGDIYYNPSGGLLSVPAVTTTGNVTVGGNLTVSGSTTTVNTATLEVEDKNIELGKVSSPSDTTADGGGITLKGASDKTINWVNATDYWTFNQGIETTAGEISIKGAEGNNAILKLTADEGDDNADYWRLVAGSGGDFTLDSKSTGSWVTGITVSGSGNLTGVGTISDSKGDVRNIPNNATTSSYTLVAADAGKCVTNTSGGVTIPYNVFSTGDTITIINHSASNITLTQGSNMTVYNTGDDGSTGNVTLKARGMATVWYQAQNLAYLSGSGLG